MIFTLVRPCFIFRNRFHTNLSAYMKTLLLYLPYSCPFSCTFELYLRSFFPSLIISNNSFLKCARHSKAPRRIVCTLAASGLNISQYDILCQAPLHIFFTFFAFFYTFFLLFTTRFRIAARFRLLNVRFHSTKRQSRHFLH